MGKLSALVYFLFFSYNLFAMDPPAPTSEYESQPEKEYWQCEGVDIYTFDNITFYRCSDEQMFNVSGKYKNRVYIKQNMRITKSPASGRRRQINSLLSEIEAGQDTSKPLLKAFHHLEIKNNFSSDDILELLRVLQIGCQRLDLNISDKSKSLSAFIEQVSVGRFDKLDEILISPKNEASYKPANLDFIPLVNLLIGRKYSGKLEIRPIENSAQVGALSHLLMHTNIEIVLQGRFDFPALSTLLLSYWENPHRTNNLIVRILNDNDTKAVIEKLIRLANLYGYPVLIDRKLPVYSNITFNKEESRRASQS